MRILIVSPMVAFNGQNPFAFILNKIKPGSVINTSDVSSGPLYLASVAMKRGHDVQVSICCKYDFEKTFTMYDPDLVLISAMDIQSSAAISMAKSARFMKRSVKVVMGGYFPTACFRNLLRDIPWLDFAVIGEGEDTLDEILSYYEGECRIKSKGAIKGVAFLRKGKIVFTGYRDSIDINKMPFPASFLIKNPFGFIITSRGCLYNCRFCCIKNFYKQTHRARSLKNVVEEIAYIKKTGQGSFKDEIKLRDDDFFIDNKAISELRTRIANRKLEKMRFSGMMRLDQLIIPGTLENLEKLNFFSVSVGLQNVSEEVLNHFRIGINKSHIRKFVKLLKRNKKIKIKIFYIINSGLPTETPESIRKNLSSFLSLIKGIKNVNFLPFILTPYSGSDLGGKSPVHEFSYLENKDYVCSVNTNYSELNHIYLSFIEEMKSRAYYGETFDLIEKVSFFFTSSLEAGTKMRMIFDSFGWCFLGILKRRNPLDYAKERIEEKYFI